MQKSIVLAEAFAQNNMDKVQYHLFLDMDGVLAEWEDFDVPKYHFYDPDFFINLAPCKHIVEAIKYIIDNCHDIKVHILSTIVCEEIGPAKDAWLDMHLPEIPQEDRQYIMKGSAEKTDALNGRDASKCFLIDDYTYNLTKWRDAGAIGIKFLNGANGFNGTWNGDYIHCRTESETLAKTICALVRK